MHVSIYMVVCSVCNPAIASLSLLFTLYVTTLNKLFLLFAHTSCISDSDFADVRCIVNE